MAAGNTRGRFIFGKRMNRPRGVLAAVAVGSPLSECPKITSAISGKMN
jgi:hypothetical protein